MSSTLTPKFFHIFVRVLQTITVIFHGHFVSWKVHCLLSAHSSPLRPERYVQRSFHFLAHVVYPHFKHILCVCVCVCSNSRNGVPRVAQRYGTIAAHTRRRASVLVVFVVFCVHMHSFAGLIRRTPPPTFSELQSPTATLIPLFSSSELTGCGYPDLFDRKNRLDMCPRWESNPRLSACKASTLSTRPGSSPNTFCILQNLLHCTVICC